MAAGRLDDWAAWSVELDPMPSRLLLTVALAAFGLGAASAPPSALGLSLTAGTGATLAPFQPGQTATGSGLLTAVDSNPTWTLTVADAGAGAGHMVKAATGCTGSSAQLTDALTVDVTSLVGAVNSAGSKAISATATTVASGSGALLLPTLLTTSYSQTIPASQAMLTGCAYTLTATYTLQ